MATFAQVMQVLYALYGPGPDEWKSKFKAKVQNFQKMGIPLGVVAGKGKKIDYTREQIYQIVVCLECADLGLTPSLTYDFISEGWPDIFDVIRHLLTVGLVDDIDFDSDDVTFVRHELAYGKQALFATSSPDTAAILFHDRRHASVIYIKRIVADLEPHLVSIGLDVSEFPVEPNALVRKKSAGRK